MALPLVARSPLTTPAAAPSWLNQLPISDSSRSLSSSRVQCSASASPSSALVSSSNSIGSSARFSAGASPVVFPPLPALDFQVDDDIEELTFLSDDESRSKPSSSAWLTPQYLSLRLRCSSLMMREASDALTRHFKGRMPPPKKSTSDRTPLIETKPAETRHKQLSLITESFEGPLELIRDVVLGDVQERFFQDLTRVSSEASK